MTNKKIKNAGFNLQIQAIVKDNWRFLAGICLVLSSEDKAIMKERKGNK